MYRRLIIASVALVVVAGCGGSATPTEAPARSAATTPTQAPAPSANATPAIATAVPTMPAQSAEPAVTSTAAAPTLEITGPEGEVFEAGQARMYAAMLTGGDTFPNAAAACHWRFYLNERDEESLVAEMENRSLITRTPDGQPVCAFTSTFIDRIGVLRVELTLDATTMAGDVVGTLVAERTYRVE